MGTPKRFISLSAKACKAFRRLARNRTDRIQRRGLYEPVRDLIEAAYVQGATDMSEGLLNRGMLRLPEEIDLEYQI